MNEEIAERLTEAFRANGITMAEAADKLEELEKHIPPPSEEDIFYVSNNPNLINKSFLVSSHGGRKERLLEDLRKIVKGEEKGEEIIYKLSYEWRDKRRNR